MITILAGGKQPTGWPQVAIIEYQKRLRKPYDLNWQFLPEEKFLKHLEKWPFSSQDFVIVCDERGQNISSDEYSKKLETAFMNRKNLVILIGGPYGFTDDIRKKADFLWSFSNLVFPHSIARLIVAEQTYRAQKISQNHPYHHR